MSDETIKDLQAQLEALKKENLEREIEAEKAKAEEDKKLKQAKEADEYKEQIRKEVMEEFAKESHITKGGEPEKMVGEPSKFKVFLSEWQKSHDLEGLTYEEKIKQICGGY